MTSSTRLLPLLVERILVCRIVPIFARFSVWRATSVGRPPPPRPPLLRNAKRDRLDLSVHGGLRGREAGVGRPRRPHADHRSTVIADHPSMRRHPSDAL